MRSNHDLMPPGGAENTIDPTGFVTIDFRLNLWINDLMMDATLTNEEEHSSYIVMLQKILPIWRFLLENWHFGFLSRGEQATPRSICPNTEA